MIKMVGTSLQGYANPELMILPYVRRETVRKQVPHGVAVEFGRAYVMTTAIQGKLCVLMAMLDSTMSFSRK
jgi:hypothetical protein